MKIDLHMHSTASDGTDKPEEIVRQCAEQGLEYAVLTDHDTIAGVAAFATEAQKQGIKTVSYTHLDVYKRQGQCTANSSGTGEKSGRYRSEIAL